MIGLCIVKCCVFKKRAAFGSALFLYLISFLLLSRLAFAEPDSCRPSHLDERVDVLRVFDGDTFELKDGRRVRFIGVNTPEMGYKGQSNEPFAMKAKKEVMTFLSRSKAVWLSFDRDRYDHYGRVLAQVFNEHKENLEEILLVKGLGFPIYFPPNLEMANCVTRSAIIAKRKNVGVWGDPYFRPIESTRLSLLSKGFHRIKGRVSNVYLPKGKRWWISLEGHVVLTISKKNQRYFNVNKLKGLASKVIQTSGWLIARKLSERQKSKGYKPFMLSIRYPASLISD